MSRSQPSGQTATHTVQLRVVWMLLALQPGLSLAYLWSVRQHWLPPTFLAPMALAMLPVGAATVSAWLWPSAPQGRRWWLAMALLVATLELGWCVLVAAMVGFAVALRSG